jgi:hypothetical protein
MPPSVAFACFRLSMFFLSCVLIFLTIGGQKGNQQQSLLSRMVVTAILENGCQCPAFASFELSVFLLVCSPELIKLEP